MVYLARLESIACRDSRQSTALCTGIATFLVAQTWMTASHAPLVIGAISLAWLTTTTASVQLDTSAQASLVLHSVELDAVVKHRVQEAETTVVYVRVVITVLMILLMFRVYLVRRGRIVPLVRLWSSFVPGELTALGTQVYLSHVQVCSLENFIAA